MVKWVFCPVSATVARVLTVSEMPIGLCREIFCAVKTIPQRSLTSLEALVYFTTKVSGAATPLKFML